MKKLGFKTNPNNRLVNDITDVLTFIEEMKESMNITNIVVVDEAIINEQPVEPRIIINYMI